MSISWVVQRRRACYARIFSSEAKKGWPAARLARPTNEESRPVAASSSWGQKDTNCALYVTSLLRRQLYKLWTSLKQKQAAELRPLFSLYRFVFSLHSSLSATHSSLLSTVRLITDVLRVSYYSRGAPSSFFELCTATYHFLAKALSLLKARGLYVHVCFWVDVA